MRKKTILAALTIVMMLFTLMPATVSAAQKDVSGEEYLENLEYYYSQSIKDRSKYCDDVWAEIQQVYNEGRASYVQIDSFETWYAAADYETMLSELGKLTWVKSIEDLPEVKSRYLKEIDEEYKMLDKADYNEYNWDMVEDYMYVGKKQINAAETFAAAAEGYSYATIGIDYATTKEELKEYKEYYISTLSMIVNLCLDPDDYSTPVWNQIQSIYEDAVAAIKAAENEYDLDSIEEEYIEKICEISGLTYPVSYEVIESVLTEIIQPALDFYNDMSDVDYIWERIDEAEEIIWNLEEELYEIEKRSDAEKLVAAAMTKLKALPKREYDVNLYKTYVMKVTAAGATGTSVKVSWNANKDLDGYIIYRAASRNGTYEKIKTCYSGKTKTYTDKNLTYGKTYYYKVKGIKDIDYDEKYTKLSAAAAGTPKLMAPSFTLKKAGTSSVQLTWKKVPGAKGYQIYRSNSVNGQFKLVKTVKKGATVQWKDTSTKKGKTYCYKMRTYTVKKDGTKKYSGYTTIKTIKR